MFISWQLYRISISYVTKISNCEFLFVYWQVFLKDTDERACAYVAGAAPNRWGFTVEGKDLFDLIKSSTVNGNL